MSDELRPEYEFDYRQAKPNPHASRQKPCGQATVEEQPAAPCAAKLVLPNGDVLSYSDVIEAIATYRHDNRAVIDLFDRTNVGPHDEILASDVLALNALNAFGPKAPMTPMTNLWVKRKDVEEAVAAITKAELESLCEAEIQAELPKLSAALLAIDGIPGFGETASPKLLHRLRPNIAPIWDSRVAAWYTDEESQKSWTAWLKRFYSEVLSSENRECLLAVQQTLDVRLSFVRIWDILLWQLPPRPM
jgi:hypothetical protein